MKISAQVSQIQLPGISHRMSQSQNDFYSIPSYKNYSYPKQGLPSWQSTKYYNDDLNKLDEIMYLRKNRLSNVKLFKNKTQRSQRNPRFDSLRSSDEDICLKFKNTGQNFHQNNTSRNITNTKVINENNALLLKTIMSYYKQHQIKVIKKQIEDKQLLNHFNEMHPINQRSSKPQIFLSNLLVKFPQIQQINQVFFDKIMISYGKNPQKIDEKISLLQFRQFYKLFISQSATQFEEIKFFEKFFDPQNNGFISLFQFEAIINQFTKKIDDYNQNLGLGVSIQELLLTNFKLAGVIKPNFEKIFTEDIIRALNKNQIHSRTLIILLTHN